MSERDGKGALSIRALSTMDEMRALEDLQRQVWPGSDLDIVPAHLLVTIEHNGGVVLGAHLEGRLVGFVLGFLGVDAASPNRVAMARLKHCSHMLGVHPEFRDRGIGFQLKLAQRRLVTGQGIRLVTWTYDPLHSRNAHLNIRRLGALCDRYVEDAYGRMRDELNQGVPSDRFDVDWWVTSTRAESRIEAKRPPLDLANFLAAGAVKLNPSKLGAGDLPIPAAETAGMDGNLLLVEIPPDFEQIKAADRALALDWRIHTREIFQRAFDDGYLVTDFVYLKGERVPRSYYLLSHGEGTLGP